MKKDEFNPRAIEQLAEKIGYTESSHPLLFLADIGMANDVTFEAFLAEVEELIEELQRQLDTGYNNVKSILELADVLIFLKKIDGLVKGLPIATHQLDFSESISQVNGQFHGDFSIFREQAQNLFEAKSDYEKNLEYLLIMLLSMVKYCGLTIQSELYAALLQRKNFANRPAEFFQIEEGLSREQILQKTNHVSRALKKIRTYLKKTLPFESVLQAWMLEYFREEINDWRHSSEALGALEGKLQQWPERLRNEDKLQLIKNETPIAVITRSLLMGGVLLRPLSLQEQVDSTLASMQSTRQKVDANL